MINSDLLNVERMVSAVLGDIAFEVLQKACKNNNLASVVYPRTILSWVNLVSKTGYDGNCPGNSDIYLSVFSDKNGLYGSLTKSEQGYRFTEATNLELASLIAVVLGLDPPQLIKSEHLVSLGNTIDRMLVSHMMDLIKSETGGKGVPQEPLPQQTPDAPIKGSGIAGRTLLVKNENFDCNICGGAVLSKGQWEGCHCFKQLTKPQIEQIEKKYRITIPEDWTDSNVDVLKKTLREEN
jgi:hypothetical protein